MLIRISDCFSGFGARAQSLPSQIRHYDCPFWRNAVMAPAHLLKPKVSSIDLRKVEEYFFSQKTRGPHDQSKAHITFFKSDFYSQKENAQTFERAGWTSANDTLTVNVWRNAVPFKQPEEIEIRVGRYFTKRLHADFTRLLKLNFGASKEFMNSLDKLHARVEENVNLIVLYDKDEKAIGTGLVVTGKRASYLYCGTISESHRGRGLWKTLVSARQAVTNSGPGHIWITSTQNKLIIGKSDLSFKRITYSKAPPN